MAVPRRQHRAAQSVKRLDLAGLARRGSLAAVAQRLAWWRRRAAEAGGRGSRQRGVAACRHARRQRDDARRLDYWYISPGHHFRELHRRARQSVSERFDVPPEQSSQMS